MCVNLSCDLQVCVILGMWLVSVCTSAWVSWVRAQGHVNGNTGFCDFPACVTSMCGPCDSCGTESSAGWGGGRSHPSKRATASGHTKLPNQGEPRSVCVPAPGCVMAAVQYGTGSACVSLSASTGVCPAVTFGSSPAFRTQSNTSHANPQGHKRWVSLIWQMETGPWARPHDLQTAGRKGSRLPVSLKTQYWGREVSLPT